MQRLQVTVKVHDDIPEEIENFDPEVLELGLEIAATSTDIVQVVTFDVPDGMSRELVENTLRANYTPEPLDDVVDDETDAPPELAFLWLETTPAE